MSGSYSASASPVSTPVTHNARMKVETTGLSAPSAQTTTIAPMRLGLTEPIMRSRNSESPIRYSAGPPTSMIVTGPPARRPE
jgi:hypothetical protein